MACTGCGGKATKPLSPSGPKKASPMKSGNQIFNFGPYGSKVSKVLTGRVQPSTLKPRSARNSNKM